MVNLRPRIPNPWCGTWDSWINRNKSNDNRLIEINNQTNLLAKILINCLCRKFSSWTNLNLTDKHSTLTKRMRILYPGFFSLFKFLRLHGSSYFGLVTNRYANMSAWRVFNNGFLLGTKWRPNLILISLADVLLLVGLLFGLVWLLLWYL